MHHILIALLRVCLILIGSAALYIGFFLYEDEEGAFQSRIMKFSVSLKARLNAKDLPLARGAASLVTVALNRIFGRGPFSWRLIFSSMALSFAALSGFLLLLNILYPLYPRNAGTVVFMVYTTIALSLTGMVILCSIYDHRWLLAFGSIPVVLIMIFVFVKTPDVGYSVIPCSIVSDVAVSLLLGDH